MDILYSVLLTLILVLINGYFSMSEMALINARRAVLQRKAELGSKKAQKAIELSANSDKLLATIQVAITLVGFGASAVATATFAAPLTAWLSKFGIGWLSAIASGLAIVSVTLIVSYVTLVLGELVPKRIALGNSENVAMSVSGPVSVFERIVSPIVALLALSTNGVSRLFRIKGTEDRQAVTEEEIKYLVTEQGSLLDEEKRMIHEIFDLGDTVAREIMVPRVDMMLMEDTTTVKETVNRMRGTGYSRIPVFHEDHDRITGIAMLKDLITPLMESKEEMLITEYMRDPVFVPDTKDILPLLGEMQTTHQQIVIVVDEYGGTAGLITIEDIVEEIVGEIADEYDSDNKYLTRLSETEWLVDGRFPIDDSMDEGFPVTESEEYETLAGWLLDAMDSVPQPGDTYETQGYIFKVQSMRRRRISLLRVSAVEFPSSKEGDMSEEGADD
ncbi:MAG: HlyC/CorC family transporter [Actinobacteria bacterium]|nr:HlyC/CorC family transporter [Actinomycetota bacterium]